MRKFSLSAAVGAAILAVGMSSAVHAANPAYPIQPAPIPNANGHGIGDVLLFPYYTVENGYNTLVHLVNTDKERTIMAKVRFREHKNSQDVLDFTVILSPNDVFTGYVKEDGGKLVFDKTDNTCTAPQGEDSNGYPDIQGDIKFKKLAGQVGGTTVGLPTTGHIEVITMGAIKNKNVSNIVLGELQRVINYLELSNAIDPAGPINDTDGIFNAVLGLSGAAKQFVDDAYVVANSTNKAKIIEAVKDMFGNVKVANAVAFGALHNEQRMPNNCFTVGDNTASGAASYFAKDKIFALQKAITPSVAGTVDKGNGSKSAIVNALSGHYTIIDFDGGVAGSSRPLVVRNAAIRGVANPCTDQAGEVGPNLICGQFAAHYPVPNLANLNGIDVLEGAALDNANFLRQLERRINRGLTAVAGYQPMTISNEFTQKKTGNQTHSEMVVTLPLKHVYMDKTIVGVRGYTGGVPEDVISAVAFAGGDTLVGIDDWNNVDEALRGGDQIFSAGLSSADNAGCLNTEIMYWDREEQEPGTPYVPPSASGPVRPGVVDGVTEFCHESGVLTFNKGVTNPAKATVDVGKSFKLNKNDPEPIENGWLKIKPLDEDAGDLTYPVANTGFVIWKRSFGSKSKNYAHIMDNTRDEEN